MFNSEMRITPGCTSEGLVFLVERKMPRVLMNASANFLHETTENERVQSTGRQRDQCSRYCLLFRQSLASTQYPTAYCRGTDKRTLLHFELKMHISRHQTHKILGLYTEKKTVKQNQAIFTCFCKFV